MRILCSALSLMLVLLLQAAAVQAGHAEDGGGRPERAGHNRPNSRYLEDWLSALNPAQQATARKILAEARPDITELRMRIQEKKMQLRELSYDRETSPETLPRLGHDLQRLRDALRAAFDRLDERMRVEVGVPLAPPKSRGCRMGHPGIPEDAASR